MRSSLSNARGGVEKRGEKRGSRDPWENGSRRADSPRSNASDSFSQPVCAATSSIPSSDWSDVRPRARATEHSPSRSPAHRLSSPAGRARRSSPPYSALFRPHPRARPPREPRRSSDTSTWIHGRPNGNVLSDARQILTALFFTFPREIFAPLTLRSGSFFFFKRIFFSFSLERGARMLTAYNGIYE